MRRPTSLSLPRLWIHCAAACLAIAGVVFAGAAGADQNDARLQPLFERLHATDDEQEGQSITAQIWEIWYQVDDVKAHELFSRGVYLMRLRRFEEALGEFNQLVVLKPEFAEGWNRRATLLYLMGELTASVDDIKRTLVLEPRHFGALSGLGLIYIQNEQWQQAIAAFEQALAVNPHMPGPRLNIEMIEQRNREGTI